MRACVQRVTEARVTVVDSVVGEIGPGLVVLLGVAQGDSDEEALQLAKKIVELRVFEDDAEKMNLGLIDVGGELLVVSQFTLLGDCRKGRRPSFTEAAAPPEAERLYERFVEEAMRLGVRVATGAFRRHMQVALTNDGPMTLLLDTR
jgi:D-tyrosyl-tRNA(Tyr) deacylase